MAAVRIIGTVDAVAVVLSFNYIFDPDMPDVARFIDLRIKSYLVKGGVCIFVMKEDKCH